MNLVPPSRMNCDAFLAGLAEYLGDELDPAAQAAADAHLSGCAACRSQVDGLVRARDAVESMVPHAEHAEARVVGLAMPSEPPRLNLLRRVARPLAVAAGLAIAFGLGYAARGPAAMPPGQPIEQASASLTETYARAARSAPATSSLTWGLMSIANR